MAFLKIRADEADIEKWKAQAHAAQLDLSKWVRTTLKDPSATVSLAIRKGILIRPDRCAKCRRKCKPHAHHDDYNYLLVVRWLCVDCHMAWHSKNEPIYSDTVDKRIVVLFPESEYLEVKAKAGFVPISVWIRNVLKAVRPGSNDEDHRTESMRRELPDTTAGERRRGVSSRPARRGH
jgi:hypothetical protein